MTTSTWTITVNQFTDGPTGHVNLTFNGPGVSVTYGNNLQPSVGVQVESAQTAARVAANPGHYYSSTIQLSEAQFNAALSFARSADVLHNSYFGLCNNCVDFANAALKQAGQGDWAIAAHLRDNTLTDTYAKLAEYVCSSWYIQLGSSALVDLLANTTRVAEAGEFVEHLSWLVDYENGDPFYQDDANYRYADSNNPDFEADERFYRLKLLAQKLGISIKYDPIENKIMMGVGSPIVIDMDGDGVETTHFSGNAVRFDIDGDGEKDRTAWISPDDAFLAWDGNGNGQIDGVPELFGGLQRGQGFARLATFDSNADGRVDTADARFAELLLWQDLNSDGQTDAGELRRAVDAGLSAITLDYRSQEVYQNGNLMGEVSSATLAGRRVDAVDVYFRYDHGPVALPHETAEAVAAQALPRDAVMADSPRRFHGWREQLLIEAMATFDHGTVAEHTAMHARDLWMPRHFAVDTGVALDMR